MLNISKQLSLPIHAATWTFADLAIKGAGKTYTACVLAEEFIKAGVPITAVDPLGIWWGLRVAADAKGKGLPVVIFGGAHRDIDLPMRQSKKDRHLIVDEEQLKLLVKSMLGAGISGVVDTSQFSKSQQQRIGGIVCEEIFRENAPFGIRHVFLEEADMLAPQKSFGENAVSVGAVDDLVRRGGNFNIGCTPITQRSAVLNKDVLTQCNCLIALRIQARLDKDAVKTWVESKVEDEKERRKIAKWYDSLRSLENGEAWIYSPENKIELTKVNIRERETLHATREYFLKEHWEQKNVKLMDVDDFVEKFKAVFEPKPVVPKVAPVTGRPPESAVASAASSPQTTRASVGITSREAWPSSQQAEILQGPRAGQEPLPATRPLPLPNDGNMTVQQTLPNLRVELYRPTISLPVEVLDQPTTALGRVAVVLKRHTGRQDEWNIKRIALRVREHAWDDSGVEDAVAQLQRWEILSKTSRDYLRFYPDRVELIEVSGPLEAR